jgi:hypothetical protein
MKKIEPYNCFHTDFLPSTLILMNKWLYERRCNHHNFGNNDQFKFESFQKMSHQVKYKYKPKINICSHVKKNSIKTLWYIQQKSSITNMIINSDSIKASNK